MKLCMEGNVDPRFVGMKLGCERFWDQRLSKEHVKRLI
jgi:hypothetical protein